MRLISMITPTLALCLSVSSLSIQSVCNQNIASNLNLKTTSVHVIMLSCLRITLISSSIVSVIMLASFPLYKAIYQEDFIYYPLLMCIPLLFFSNTSGVLKGYLEANNNFTTPYLSNLIESLTKFLVTVLLLYIFKSYSIHVKIMLVFIALTLSEASSNLLLAYKIKHKRKIRKVKTNFYERHILKQAIPLTMSSLCTTIGGYLSPFLFYYASKKVGVDFIESTTYYALVSSYAIPLLLNGQYGILSISKFIFPNITKNIGNISKQNRILNYSFFGCLIISTFCFVLCFFHAETILNFMYKDSSSAHMVRYLAPVYFLLYFDPILISILQAYNKEKPIFWISFLTETIFLGCILIFCSNSTFSLTGFLLSIVISSIFKCCSLFYISIKTSNYSPPKRKTFFIFGYCLCYLLLASKTSFLGFLILSLVYFLLSGILFYFAYKNKLKHPLIQMHR